MRFFVSLLVALLCISSPGFAGPVFQAVPSLAPVIIPSSGTPALNPSMLLQYTTLSTNATATVSGIAPGQDYTIEICQPASFPAGCTGNGGTANTYCTFAWPAAVHGGMAMPQTAATCSVQNFKSYNGATLVATNTGINVAP